MTARTITSEVARAIWGALCIGCRRGEILGRYRMYQALRSQLAGRTLGERVLSISHSRKLCALLGARENSVVEVNYPPHSLDHLPFESERFSAVVSDQVLEHISCTPSEAVNEVYRVLCPGGIAIHTTCFMTPYHGSRDPKDLDNADFWRITPSGLARLHMNYSEIITADGWGNPLLPMLGGLGLLHVAVPERHVAARRGG
jgi:SAM-dependent methyltransferase